MPRRVLKRFLPDRHALARRWFMRPFTAALGNPAYWTVHRRSIQRAFAIGLFICFIPLPVHLVVAPIAAIAFRANIPLTLVTVLLVNPFTIVPVFFGAYWVGAQLTDSPLTPFQIALTWDWAQTQLVQVWKPLLLGCLVCGVTAAMLGYAGMSLLWRWHVAYRYQHRPSRLRSRSSATEQNSTLKR